MAPEPDHQSKVVLPTLAPVDGLNPRMYVLSVGGLSWKRTVLSALAPWKSAFPNVTGSVPPNSTVRRDEQLWKAQSPKLVMQVPPKPTSAGQFQHAWATFGNFAGHSTGPTRRMQVSRIRIPTVRRFVRSAGQTNSRR